MHPKFGHFDGLFGSGLPIVFSETEADLSGPAPKLGEQTDAVLRELGYDEERIRVLREEHVL